MLSVKDNPPSLWPDCPITDIQGTWKVAHLKPRQEKALAKDLIVANIPYCCPFFTKTTRRKDNNKTRKSVLPAFSGYLSYISTPDADKYLWKSNRIMKILPVNDQKLLVTELNWTIIALSKNMLSYSLNSPTLEKGQRVKVMAGPMKDFVGDVVKINSEDFVLISVAMFGQSVAVKVDSNMLKPIPKSNE